jgi:arginyl-tRNA synthetase
MELINKQLENLIQKNVKNIFNIDTNVEIQSSNKKGFGDFATNFAMVNSKKFGRNPREIAKELIDNFSENDIIEKLEIAGPGFINIFLKNEFINDEFQKIGKEDYDFSFLDNGKKLIIDYSSPNIAKRMHIGHLRSTIIGDSIKRIMKFTGFEILADNHIGDWGTQFGKLIVGYDRWLNKKNYEEDPIEELERIYVKFSEESKLNPELENIAREELRKLQSGDEKNNNLWHEFINISLKEYDKVYKRLDITFDLYNGESFYNDMMPDIINELLAKNIATEDQDALVVFFDEDTKLHPCIVQKKDGSFLYSTSDLATIKYRRKALNIDKAIYITDERQQDHFRQVFKIAEMLGDGFDYEKVHIWFGIMRFKDAIFSTRLGNIIKLNDLLDEAKREVRETIDIKNPGIPDDEKEKIAEIVGIGAIKYFDLSQNRTTPIIFEWEKVLSFEGNTGPYLQYTYARIMSIFRKLNEENIKYSENSKIILESEIERDLALMLLNFPNVVVKAGETYRPNLIADYLFETAKTFSTFYNQRHIANEENPELKNSRIALAANTAHILKTGLDLLGIKTVNRM